jgi:hypothetical protein
VESQGDDDGEKGCMSVCDLATGGDPNRIMIVAAGRISRDVKRMSIPPVSRASAP